MSIFRGLVVWVVTGLGSVGVAGEVLLVFTAEWCGPCQQFKQDLAEDPELAGGYEVDIVDGELVTDMARDFGVKNYPAFYVVKVAEDGALAAENVVKKHVGYTGPRKLKKWLER